MHYVPALPKIVVLCGSTRFREEFYKYNQQFTIQGWIVLAPAFFKGDKYYEDAKPMLDELHLRKIDMADLVFIINRDGYVGKSTRNEINYAKKAGKEIAYLISGE